MRIAIDASSLLPPRTGIGNYTFNLIRHLAIVDQENEYRLFLNSLRRRFDEKSILRNHPNFSTRRTRIPGPVLLAAWKNLHAPPLSWFAGPADITHAPASILPPAGKSRLVLTLHDCYFMRHPEHCHALGGLYLRKTLHSGIHRCDAIICVSDFTRREAISLFSLEANKLHVIHSGVDTDLFAPPADGASYRRTLQKYRLPQEYLLAVATQEPRKNLAGLCRAYKVLCEQEPDTPALVIAGSPGFGDNLSMLIHALRLNKKVTLTGFVQQADLPVLYTNAMLYLMPSLYEGFGLPILEAMACGAPVLAADIEGLREAGGEAARFMPIETPEAMAHSILEAIQCSKWQEEARARGMQRARQFSWTQTARKTLSIYQSLAK